MNSSESQEILFMQVVYQNQQLALIGLGKLKNPISNVEEKNLEQAKMAIDILDMLSVKTKGNLSEREDRFLQDVLRDLKLNYVSETK
jgi:hypothetical protein